jgi:signal transduction histidine kinase
MARIISHLGERLISSSDVALLELIKNSYDAGSKFVEITIDQKNKQMVIYDEGHGMDKETIENFWLVVGTTHRLEDKMNIDQDDEDVPLGEKGLGRFATMKLGNNLKLETSTETSEKIWNLEIEWWKYGYRSQFYLDEVENNLFSQPKTSNISSFTKITIDGLKDFINEDWTEAKIDNFIANSANKFVNPYNELPRKFVIRIILINKQNKKVTRVIGQADTLLFNQAHHEIFGMYKPGCLYYSYKIRRNGMLVDEGEDIPHYFDSKIDLKDKKDEGYVGPFSFHFYVFNRSRLGELTGFESVPRIREMLDRYVGGPMIFRDGFRIFPYGDPGDDWLQLNKEKFRMGKVKIVGEQTAGFISLNSSKTPYLVDQTNREGLVKNKSYENFHEIVRDLFNILVNVVIRNEPKETSADITISARRSADNIEKTILNIKQKGVLHDTEFKQIIKDSKLIKNGIREIKKRERALIETSAVGMTSMQIAHEIHNFINKIYSNIESLKSELPSVYQSKFEMLEMNLRSLKTMISQIDEQAATLRRAKSTINLVQQLKDIVNTIKPVALSYEEPINIKLSYENEDIKVKINKGLITQLFDNLILNSMYWINSLGTSDQGAERIIRINITSDGVVEYSDSGPGIAQVDEEAIFEPFFSRKKGGKGLGLYISKEIAAFHGITLELLPRLNSSQRFHCFHVDFTKVRSWS